MKLWKVIFNTRAFSFFKRRLNQTPRLIHKYERVNNLHQVEVSFVIPVHNQREIIANNVKSLLSCITLDSEIIFVDDSSSDGSRDEIFDAISGELPQEIKQIFIYRFEHPIFESACDDFGIKSASGKYIIEIQADMQMQESGFDKKMTKVLKENPDIFMLSGRGVMRFDEIAEIYSRSFGTESNFSRSLKSSIAKNLIKIIRKDKGINFQEPVAVSTSSSLSLLQNLVFPTKEEFSESGRAGRLGPLIEINPIDPRQHLYIGDTVMRGPICFNRERYVGLGGFNLQSFFLGYDEHELNLRARIQRGWRSGFLNIDFVSPLAHGSMRKSRSLKSKFELYLAVKRISVSPSSFLSDYTTLKSDLQHKFDLRETST